LNRKKTRSLIIKTGAIVSNDYSKTNSTSSNSLQFELQEMRNKKDSLELVLLINNEIKSLRFDYVFSFINKHLEFYSFACLDTTLIGCDLIVIRRAASNQVQVKE